MAENNYMTLCPHCKTYLPARMFGQHREGFFNLDTNYWQRDPCLGDSSDGESNYMEIDHLSLYVPCSPGHSHDSESGSGNGFLKQPLLNMEI